MTMNGMKVGILEIPKPQSGEYLSTLHQWGELPSVVSLPDLARMLAVLCRQNEAALQKVLTSALLRMEVEFFGLSESGKWMAELMRVLVPLGKPRIKPATNTRERELKIPIELPSEISVSNIHIDAMGMRPADAVQLLVSRGRKVPPELLDFLPAAPVTPARAATPEAVVAVDASDAPTTQSNFMKKVALIAELEYEWQSINKDISDATRNGLKAAAHAGKHGEWDRDKARAWAVSKGKIKQAAPVHTLAAAWSGAVTRHTING